MMNGDFNSYRYAGEFESKDSTYKHGTLMANFNFFEGIGLALMNAQFYNSGDILEKRLLRFGKK
ncbi:MAG: hypothetical protein HKN51_15450 [Saprospiraceae bacterium]|nr:hypothetical protein [Saprospiraceae bacterium]